MVMLQLSEALNSIEDLVQQEVADYYFLDNCALGTDFLIAERDFFKNRNVDLLEKGYASAKASLIFLEQNNQFRTTPIVLGEFEAKINYLSYLIRDYQKLVSPTNLQKEEKNKLELIAREELKIRDLLRSRIHRDYKNLDFKLLHAFKRVVVEANIIRSATKLDNFDDESIMGEAIYHAFSKNMSGAIVTRDSRFPKILINTQHFVYGHPGLENLEEFFRNGKISVILGPNPESKRTDYHLDYNSKDFRNVDPR